MLWVIENGGFVSGDILLESLKKLNKDFVLWNDDFWKTKEYESFDKTAIFHGSLGNVSKIKKEISWTPGSLCDENGFSFQYIYENYNDFILNKNCIFTTIKDLLENPSLLDDICKTSPKFFARPNSPLKEFSGRILDKSNLTPAHFDYGFYHENINLPIVLSELKSIEKEYRFVCVNDSIVTGCEYLADGRKGTLLINQNDDAWKLAQKIACVKKQKDFAYIIDICQSEGDLFLLEMNPFSGADLYVCNAEKIINSIESVG